MYVEGLAEFFAYHTFDGKEIQFGVIDRAPAHYARHALHGFIDIRERCFRSLALQREYPDLAEGWALVAFLYTQAPDVFRPWSQTLDQGFEPEHAWDVALADHPDLPARYERWLQSLVDDQPWIYNFGPWEAWQRQGELWTFEGQSTGIYVIESDTPEAAVRVRTEGRRASAGLVLNYQNPSDFTTVKVNVTGSVNVEHFRRPAPRQSDAGLTIIGPEMPSTVNFRSTLPDLVADPTDFVMRIRFEGEEAVIYVDDVELIRWPASDTGTLGFTASDGKATFELVD